MKKPILIAIVAVVVIVVITGGYIGYNAVFNEPPATPTPTPPTNIATQETIRDAAIMYIATEYTDMASLTTDLTWTGGRQETGLIGSDTYIYTAGNWNITITNPVVLDPIYTISAVYTDTANQVTIEWLGTYQSGTITETSYNYIVP